MSTRHPLLLTIAGVVTWAWLTACSQQESVREIDWAKAALARNPDFEILATDEKAGVFTVRDTASGETRTLLLKDLIAAPAPARATPAAAPAATPAASPSPESTPSAPADSSEPGVELAGGQTTPADAPLAEGPGYRISRGSEQSPEAAAAPLEGPGYRIERSPGQAREPAQTPPAAVTPAAVTGERRTDPIICQGNRLMRIDGETIEFTGDAVIAEKGCDLFISNARIRAGGVGIIARQQARVHIVNSTIGGSRGSYEASEGGEIYVARSTFEGIGRRFDGGSMTDLGGNIYSTR
jgi:hypothetical protein